MRYYYWGVKGWGVHRYRSKNNWQGMGFSDGIYSIKMSWIN
jgi:hypothetical protein